MLSSTQFAIIVFTLFEVIILSDRRIYAAETGEAVNNYQFLYRGNKDNNDDDNRIVVKDYYAQDSSTHFQLSTKPYVVEFYSPSCVSLTMTLSIQNQSYELMILYFFFC